MSPRVYAGLFFVSLATLMFELVLTRIWSVTMWYHFAFVAISVAMFGMTVGALTVYFFPRFFREERTAHVLAQSAALFAATMVLGFLTQLCIPLIPNKSFMGLYSAALTYGVIAIPFCFSGIFIALTLTRFKKFVSQLYAVDLLGAAVGCVLFVYLLQITDGPTAVFVAGLVASIGAALLAAEARSKLWTKAAIALALVLATFSGVNTALANREHSLLGLPWIKGFMELAPVYYEKWNAFSRVTVSEGLTSGDEALGWGLNAGNHPKFKGSQLWLGIDGTGVTAITEFSGKLDDVAFLKWDVTNIAHYLRKDARVLVVGAGGGRGVLSALVFKQKSVVAVDINDIIINLLKGKYADFSGHLDRYPGVTLVSDEARSYVARGRDRFDIIELALVNTGAASAAGNFALTENSLYTREAWRLFLEHLEPQGIVSCARWYFEDCPGEVYRLAAVARAALNDLGFTHTRDRIVVITNRVPTGGCVRVGTMLVSKRPFSQVDLDVLAAVAREKQFDIVLSPQLSTDPNLAAIASGEGLAQVARRLPVRITPATDDNPFFFYLVKPEHIFNPPAVTIGTEALNRRAPVILAELLLVVFALTIVCILPPLVFKRRNLQLARDWPYLSFFLAIGFGYMLIEMSQLERLIIFLGHPTYSLSVVLFTLLLASGIGSYLTNFLRNSSKRPALICLAAILCSLAAFGVLTPSIIQSAEGADTIARIALSVAMLAPIGLLLGTAFPLGFRLATERRPQLAPWLWGINGAASVCASVVAVAIAITAGITAAFWTGVAFYVIALASVLCISRETGQTSDAQAPLEEAEQESGLTRQTGT